MRRSSGIAPMLKHCGCERPRDNRQTRLALGGLHGAGYDKGRPKLIQALWLASSDVIMTGGSHRSDAWPCCAPSVPTSVAAC